MFFTVYKNHEIITSGDNFRIKTPSNEYLPEVAASVETAKKWIDALQQKKLDEITSKPHVIVTGNPIDGFEVYGAFGNFDAAASHVQNDGNMPDCDFWIMPLHSVKE